MGNMFLKYMQVITIPKEIINIILQYFLEYLINEMHPLFNFAFQDAITAESYKEILLEQSLTSLNNTLESYQYWQHSPLISTLTEEQVADNRNYIALNIFGAGVVNKLLQKFVNSFFAISPNELEKWNGKPEEYIISSFSSTSINNLRVFHVKYI